MKNSSEKNKTKKEIVNVLRKILKYICTFIGVCLIIYNILYLYNNTVKDKKYAQIFNLYISTEKENSMSPTITKNSLIIGYKLKDIVQNEIVGYDIDNSIKYHRLMKIKSENGKITYITKADNNYHEDIEEKQISDLKAKIIIKIPMIGWLFRIFESKITTVIIILLLGIQYSYNNYKIKQIIKRKNEKEKNIEQ